MVSNTECRVSLDRFARSLGTPTYKRQTMIHTKCLLAVLAAALLLNCSGDRQRDDSSGEVVPGVQSRSETAEPAFISLTDSSDYRADFREAIQAGDLRFIAVMGYATEVLGVPDYHKKYRATNGHKIVEGTSDTFRDRAEMVKNIFAREYAKGYNSLLLQYLADHPK